ncbi:unnamed protein product [Cylicocyclus nassatus]|uniref:Uncharacterized protein n=1 Tax=Cylicocyclus nassatus TaxID=53992 RepID=A0AA36GT59_CYLNA|nr:unnamed protein product [Cylicocyclus nassatus]
MESCWKGEDDNYSYSEIVRHSECVDASSPTYDLGSITGDFVNSLPSLCEEFPQDYDNGTFYSDSTQQVNRMGYSPMPLEKDPFQNILDQVDFSLDIPQPSTTNFVPDGTLDVDFPGGADSAPLQVKMAEHDQGSTPLPLHSQDLCSNDKTTSCEMHESEIEFCIAGRSQQDKNTRTEGNPQMTKAPAQQAIAKQISSTKRTEDLICDQTQSTIARLRIFFRAYGRAIASSALLNPDELTSQATGFPLNIVLACNDPVPKKPCITLTKKKRKEQEDTAKDGAPVRNTKKKNSSGLGKNEKLLATISTKSARRRGKKDTMCDNTSAKSATKKNKAGNMSTSTHSSDLPDDPNPSDIPKSRKDCHFEDAPMKKSCAEEASEGPSPFGIKNIKGYTMGIRWSERIEHKAKVFYGNVQRRRSQSDQNTPEPCAYDENAAQCRSSGRKRRPRRVFSPLLTKEKKKYFMLMDLLRERFRIAVESKPEEVLDEVVLSFE